MTNLKQKIDDDLKKSLGHLEYSFNKVKKLSSNVPSLGEEDLETWESFSSRFSRASDIFVSKFLRFKIKEKDPAFRGSVIDLLNEAEKFGWIENAQIWRRIRELRNVAAHDYAASDLSALFQELVKLCPEILKVQALCV